MSGGDAAVAVVATQGRAGGSRAVPLAIELASSGRRVSLVATSEPEGEDARRCRAAGVDVVVAPELEVEITPGFLAESYRLYLALRSLELGAVVFGDRGGAAFCSAAAKRLGLDFASTAIVVDCDEPTLRAAIREKRSFLSKGTVGRIVTERLAIELADAVVGGPDALAWLEAQGWTLPRARVELAGDRAGVKAWETALAVSSDAPRVEADTPLVSVVVPRYERTGFLPHCLEGLTRQTYEPLEVIVADDGSTSTAAAEQLAELEARTWPWPFRVLRLPHGGLGAVRNAGAEAASGELVLFFDDDDVPFAGLVSTLARGLAASGADAVIAGARCFRGDGAPASHPGDVVRIPLGRPRELGVLSNQFGGPVCLWRRDLFLRLAGFRTGTRIFEDWELYARATLAGAHVLGVPEPLYWYRQTPGGMFSADPFANRDETLVAVASVFAEQLPDGADLLPLLAAGAYEELERRKVASVPRRRRVAERARLLARRAREVRAESGPLEVVRRALELARKAR